MAYIGNQPFTTAFLTDQFSGTGSQTAFTLSAAPANTNSLLVAVTGVLQDPSTYSVNGTTLTFSAAPPSGTANISVRFLGIPASGVTTTAYRTLTEFTATAGQTTFTPPSYTVGFLNVYRNGVLLGTADYTASNGTTVVLVNPASAGDLVVTESFYVSSVLNAIPGTAGSVGTTYLVDGSVTTAKIADANVTQAKLASGVAGNGPAFSAYASGAQSINNATATKIAFQTEEFDTNSCYDNATNYRFTPTVAGYYQVNAGINWGGWTSTYTFIMVYKNGAELKRGSSVPNNAVGLNNTISCLVYLNGSTDYVEIYGQHNNGSAQNTSAFGPPAVFFQASMVRAA
jgi:hypothetical protein